MLGASKGSRLLTLLFQLCTHRFHVHRTGLDHTIDGAILWPSSIMLSRLYVSQVKSIRVRPGLKYLKAENTLHRHILSYYIIASAVQRLWSDVMDPEKPKNGAIVINDNIAVISIIDKQEFHIMWHGVWVWSHDAQLCGTCCEHTCCTTLIWSCRIGLFSSINCFIGSVH